MEVIDVEYIYSALILNSLEKDVTEANVKKVLEAAGAKPDEAKIKALVSSLDGVDIKEAISKSVAMAAAPAAAAPAAGESKEEAKEEEESEEDEEQKAEEAASGLANLFG